MRSFFLLLIFSACVFACSSSPANVAGTYTVAVTNRDNGCQIGNWTVGSQSTNIPVVITQDSTDMTSATANVMGGGAIGLDLLLGSSTFTGDVSGSNLSMKIFGTVSFTQSTCSYTYNATLAAGLTGDALAGTIVYTTSTNSSPDCGTLVGCKSEQAFNGSRPPAP
jgi:hypothetical protein